MKKYKKHIMAATLVLALGAAVYLNWSLSSTQTTSKTLGQSEYVNATLSTEETTASSNKTSATEETKKSSKSSSTATLTKKQKNFFAQAESNRKQTQDEVIDEAAQILELEDTSEEEMTQAQLQAVGIMKNFTLQDSIETTLNAKGFTKCLSYISDQGCVVTVLKSELNDSTSMIVKATVQSITNIDFDKISIVTV